MTTTLTVPVTRHDDGAAPEQWDTHAALLPNGAQRLLRAARAHDWMWAFGTGSTMYGPHITVSVGREAEGGQHEIKGRWKPTGEQIAVERRSDRGRWQHTTVTAAVREVKAG